MSKDFYKTLGVDRSASADEIKKAYRKLALKFHPDRNKAKDAESRFAEISSAYAVLADEDKRRRYDQFGENGVGASPGSVGFADFFSSIFDMSGRGHRRSGSDSNISIAITLEECVKGVEKHITHKYASFCTHCQGLGGSGQTCSTCQGHGKVQRKSSFMSVVVTCANCNGSGQIVTKKCSHCKGDGHVLISETISAKIPPGVDDNDIFILSGQGHSDQPSTPRGNLKLHVRVQSHDIFTRQNHHLLMTKTISFLEACVGSTVDIPTITGTKVGLHIPKGTQFGQIFRIHGHGVPSSYGMGDLLVKIDIIVPKKLSAKAASALKEFDNLNKEDV